METLPNCEKNADASNLEFARCFLRLAHLPNFALDRLSRYESTLWRQAGRILHALETLDRRKPKREGAVLGLERKLTSIANDRLPSRSHVYLAAS